MSCRWDPAGATTHRGHNCGWRAHGPHLDQLAKEDEGKAKRELFKGSSAGAGSSSQAVTTPKKKKSKRENAFVPSPDGGLAADHPDRDGKRSSAAVYVDTPPKKQGKAKLADRF